MCAICEYMQEKEFFASVRENVCEIPFALDKCTESIKNSYDVYRRHRLLTISEPIVDKCQEFAVDIRTDKGLDGFQIKRKLTFLEVYHKGIISVKNIEIKDIEAKMNTKRWISWVTGTLGMIWSIAFIISFF